MRKFCFLCILLFCVACGRDPAKATIQGVWTAAEGESSSGSTQLFVEWQFSRGGFTLQQEIRRDELMISTGSYRVVEQDGDILMVELYNISGDVFTYNNQPVVYKFEIDPQTGRMQINSREFVRIR